MSSDDKEKKLRELSKEIRKRGTPAQKQRVSDALRKAQGKSTKGSAEGSKLTQASGKSSITIKGSKPAPQKATKIANDTGFAKKIKKLRTVRKARQMKGRVGGKSRMVRMSPSRGLPFGFGGTGGGRRSKLAAKKDK